MLNTVCVTCIMFSLASCIIRTRYSKKMVAVLDAVRIAILYRQAYNSLYSLLDNLYLTNSNGPRLYQMDALPWLNAIHETVTKAIGAIAGSAGNPVYVKNMLISKCHTGITMFYISNSIDMVHTAFAVIMWLMLPPGYASAYCHAFIALMYAGKAADITCRNTTIMHFFKGIAFIAIYAYIMVTLH